MIYLFVYLFIWGCFQHCTGHITTGSWKGRGKSNQRGLGGAAVRILASNLGGRQFESRAGCFMLESW